PAGNPDLRDALPFDPRLPAGERGAPARGTPAGTLRPRGLDRPVPARARDRALALPAATAGAAAAARRLYGARGSRRPGPRLHAESGGRRPRPGCPRRRAPRPAVSSRRDPRRPGERAAGLPRAGRDLPRQGVPAEGIARRDVAV